MGEAIIDTGGGYELMLRDSFGLGIVGEVEVLAFGGLETVFLTEGFRFHVDGWPSDAATAIVGLSVCDCNGVGFEFFRKTGAVLGVDFVTLTAVISLTLPSGGVTLPFERPPPTLPAFDSAFIDVDVFTGGEHLTVRGLLDTGTNSSVMRRGLFAPISSLQPNRINIFVEHPALGTVAANVMLFDTAGLPDIILGTDIMRAWSDRWYFQFIEEGGTVTTFPRYDIDDDVDSGVATQDRK